MSFDRAATLASWRAEARPDEIQCRLLFGVGPEVLERIEAGEVEPEPDIAARILSVILSAPPVPGGAGAGGFPNYAGATLHGATR